MSPTVNHRLEELWTESVTFHPDRYVILQLSQSLSASTPNRRFIQSEASNSEKFCYVPFGAGQPVPLLHVENKHNLAKQNTTALLANTAVLPFLVCVSTSVCDVLYTK